MAVKGRKLPGDPKGKPSGPWQARHRPVPGGRERARTFAVKAEAELWLAAECADPAAAYLDPDLGRVTLRVAEAHVARQTWRPATTRTAKASLRHVLDVRGDRPLNTIRRSDVRAVIAGLDLAPSAVRIVHQHLSGVFEAALDDG